MRVDDKIIQQIDKIRLKERETACCIRNDDSGCVQSSQADCSVRKIKSTFYKIDANFVEIKKIKLSLKVFL